MIGRYLTQSAVWKRVTGRDPYGNPITATTIISVRWEGRRTLVRNAQGEQVISDTQLFTVEPVQPGDIIQDADGREWPVITVTTHRAFSGAELYRQVML